MKDFLEFRKMISIQIIKILYVVGAVAITIGGIVMLFVGDNLALLGIGVLIIGNLLWRVICEGWIIVFSIHDILSSIESKKMAD